MVVALLLLTKVVGGCSLCIAECVNNTFKALPQLRRGFFSYIDF